MGLKTDHFLRCDNYTGALVRNHGGTQPFVNTYLRRSSAGSTFSPADLDEDVLAKSKWLHVTGISVAISESSKEAVIRAIEIARKSNVGISFDLNFRKKLWSEEDASTALKSIIKDLDVVSGGVDEYEVIFGSKDPEENLATVAALGVKTVIMTAGPDEMRILHEGKRFNYTPEKVKLVDPVGSGDAFISGTISGLIGGLSIEDAIAQGSKCGAAVAATRGDWALMITGEKGILIMEETMANELSFASGLVAIIRTKTADEARAAASALIAAGVDVIEFTTTTPAVFDLIEEFASNTSNTGVHVGLGTAMTRAHVLSGKDAGAKFVISPHVSQEVIEATKQAGLISIPGVASPTEVADALRFGADILKFFPASALGPNYLKAVCEPFPGLNWMATGGISVETIPDWVAAGVSGFGVGGKLTSGGVSEIPNRVAEFKAAIAAARGK